MDIIWRYYIASINQAQFISCLSRNFLASVSASSSASILVFSIAKIAPETAKFLWFTRWTQESNAGFASSWPLKASPSSFNFCPSAWSCHPFPRTSSTRRMYVSNWRSIWRAQMIEPETGGISRPIARADPRESRYWTKIINRKNEKKPQKRAAASLAWNLGNFKKNYLTKKHKITVLINFIQKWILEMFIKLLLS